MQQVNNEWQPLAFSKKLSAAKAARLADSLDADPTPNPSPNPTPNTNFPQNERPAYYRELLAIYEAVQHFRYVLKVQHCTIFTDHKPLNL